MTLRSAKVYFEPRPRPARLGSYVRNAFKHGRQLPRRHTGGEVGDIICAPYPGTRSPIQTHRVPLAGSGGQVSPPGGRFQKTVGRASLTATGSGSGRRGGAGTGRRRPVRLEDDGGGGLTGALDLLVPLQVLVVVVDVGALPTLSLDLRNDQGHQGRGVEDDDDDDIQQLVDLAVPEGLLQHDADDCSVHQHHVAFVRRLHQLAIQCHVASRW